MFDSASGLASAVLQQARGNERCKHGQQYKHCQTCKVCCGGWTNIFTAEGDRLDALRVAYYQQGWQLPVL
jgi:hypothetical protein